MKPMTYPVKERIRITQINSFFRLPCSETYEFSGESHNFWEMMYVVKGSLCVSADERVYHLSSGQIIFHQPLELHKFYITDKGGAEILVISYLAEGRLRDFFREKIFLLNESQKNILNELIAYAESYACETESIYHRYLPAFLSENLYSQKVSLYIHQLLLSLAESNSITPLPESEDSAMFTKAVQYMNDRIYENLSVEEIASDLHMSVSTLKRIFKRYAGLGIHKYFLKLKLKTAIDLLGNGETVTGVSRKMNFSSQGYFTNVFQREIGESPSSYLLKGTPSSASKNKI